MYNEKYASDFPNSNYLSNLNNLNGTNQNIHLNRLPTLGEILANKSKSPVDLFTFYQFMQDVEGRVDYLDFWFDLINHLNLCKHYVKGLRDSIVRQSSHFQSNSQHQSQQIRDDRSVTSGTNHQTRNSMSSRPNSATTPTGGTFLFRNSNPISEKSKHKSLSSSILLDLIINDNILEENDSHRLSAFLRGDINLDNLDPKLKDLIEQYNAEIEANENANRGVGTSAQNQHSPGYSSGMGKSSPSFLSNSRMSGSSFHPPNHPHEAKRVSSHSALLNRDHDDDDDDEGDSIDHFLHSNDSSYENQLDIGQADQAVNPSKYVSLHPGKKSDTSIDKLKQDYPQPQSPYARHFSGSNNRHSNRRESTVNPSLLERLIRDSPATSNGSFINRENLRESSHNLLLKYFVEDSEKNLNLPPQVNAYIIKSIEVDGRDDPDVFNYVKHYVFNRLENDHLPKFLDFMATRNINHSNFARIVVGFFLLFIAFWVSFILVFLNYRKGLRPVIVLPYLFAFYLIVSSIYLIDPVMAWFGISETFSKKNGQSLIRVREKFVYQFILKRSLWVLFLILIFTAAMTVLFSLVPGHRL
ncbi:RAX1 [Candida margitis]|uniref:RAX1 n=1 Tax=Candida margitis TaxID=1775924 RepID=UPI0022267CEB|nr:RAX1 [Candida margitis]KAI5969564.1 RAX1 [Candida margitis]